MNKSFIIFLSFFKIVFIFLNITLIESYSQQYMQIDNNVIPLLTPPYKLTKDIIHDNTISRITNITYIIPIHK